MRDRYQLARKLKFNGYIELFFSRGVSRRVVVFEHQCAAGAKGRLVKHNTCLKRYKVLRGPRLGCFSLASAHYLAGCVMYLNRE